MLIVGPNGSSYFDEVVLASLATPLSPHWKGCIAEPHSELVAHGAEIDRADRLFRHVLKRPCPYSRTAAVLSDHLQSAFHKANAISRGTRAKQSPLSLSPPDVDIAHAEDPARQYLSHLPRQFRNVATGSGPRR